MVIMGNLGEYRFFLCKLGEYWGDNGKLSKKRKFGREVGEIRGEIGEIRANKSKTRWNWEKWGK